MLGAKETPARFCDVVRETDVHLHLVSDSQPDVLRELVASLGLGAEDCASVLKIVQRRESMGSTGVGHGVAVPTVARRWSNRLHVVFGRQPLGVAWCGADGSPSAFSFFWSRLRPKCRNDYSHAGQGRSLRNDPDTRRRLGEIRTGRSSSAYRRGRALAPAPVMRPGHLTHATLHHPRGRRRTADSAVVKTRSRAREPGGRGCDGSDGIDRAAAERPDLNHSGPRAPDIAGADVCREIRKWSGAPILVLSARHSDEERWHC